jgi:hypothetical protein
MPEPLIVDEKTLKLVGALLDGSTERLKPYHRAVAKALEHLAHQFQDEICLRTLAIHAGVS